MPLTTVVLDLGETLVDETSLWRGWATWLDVPELTLFGVLGGLAARGEDHRLFLQAFRPGASWDETVARKNAELPWWMGEASLYPDAVPCLQALRDQGWRVVVGGNQPAQFQELVERLDLPVDVVTSSGSLGVEKPEPAFYRAVATLAGADVAECAHVGDRVDNDVVGAQDAGMTAVHLVRGPWGHLHAGDPRIRHQVRSLSELPSYLQGLR